mgnify:CR=1 FL=1
MLTRHTLTLFALLLHSSTGLFTAATAVAVAAPSFEAAAAADTRPPLPSTEADDAFSADPTDEDDPPNASEPNFDERLERFIARGLQITRGHGGEVAVGTGCGALVGWVVRRLQGALMTAAVLGGLGAAGAMHVGWVTAAQLQVALSSVVSILGSQVVRLANTADLDGDGSVTVEDSKLAISRVTPYVQRHPGLTAGLASGFVIGYRQMLI